MEGGIIIKKDKDIHNIHGYNNTYREIAVKFGNETAIQFFNDYKGMQITFPQKLYSNTYIKTYINGKLKEGINTSELITDISKKFDYSESWARKLIKKHKERSE